jgi:hydroxylamine reductase (hybrid-cluster protein)
MPGWKHINKNTSDGQKDFSEIIAMAQTCPAPRK